MTMSCPRRVIVPTHPGANDIQPLKRRKNQYIHSLGNTEMPFWATHETHYVRSSYQPDYQRFRLLGSQTCVGGSRDITKTLASRHWSRDQTWQTSGAISWLALKVRSQVEPTAASRVVFVNISSSNGSRRTGIWVKANNICLELFQVKSVTLIHSNEMRV